MRTGMWARGLSAGGWETTVLTSAWRKVGPAEFAFGRARVMRLWPAPASKLSTHRFTRAVRHWLKQQADRVDVVLTSASPFVLGIWDDLKQIGPVVLRVDQGGDGRDEASAALLDAALLDCCREAAAVIAPCLPVRQALVRSQLPGVRVPVIADGVSPTARRDAPQRDAARVCLAQAQPSLALPAGASLAVAPVLDEDESAVDLVRSWTSVRCMVPQGRLWLLDFRTRGGDLRTLISRLGLGSHVVVAEPLDDLHDVLTAADIFVLPSAGPQIPLFTLQAMEAGLPIVTVDRPESRDVMGAQAAELVNPGDGTTLAAAIVDLMRRPERAEALGRAGRDRARQRFDLDRAIDRLAELLQDLPARRTGTIPSRPPIASPPRMDAAG